ncbi:hypothetical protein M9H77_24835 [Catharanthus roseus]|uniref:Uncharacterized protein n=1 Tax=Catharanthus roseus TaxID=4058 RepID=A0ACC0A7W8_CATRO|nr:hypothetical protein M9H77_24835 [Catharanthus roseus]
MDSDEDYQSFSPQVEHRRLKRLRKKAIQAPSSPLLDPVNVLRSVSSVDFSEWEALENSRSKTLDSLYNDDTNESSNPMPDSVDDLLGIPRVDFGKLEAEEASGARTPDSLCGDDSNGPSNSAEDLLPITRVDFAKLEALEASVTKDLDDSNEPLLSQSSCQENEMESGFGEELDAAENSSQFGVGFGEDRRETKRTLEFDNLDQRSELKLEKPEKKRIIESPRHGENEEEENTKQKKKKRIKSESGDDLKSIRAPNKRKQEKERKAYLQQLHADSQRLLRETRDASFKPAPVVNKPISSILEKIRKRKLEVSKKMVNSNAFIAENNGDIRDALLGTESENAYEERKQDNPPKAVGEDSAVDRVDAVNASILEKDNSNKSVSPSSSGKFPSEMDCDEKPTPMFRPPIDDTQHLFGDSQTREIEADQPVDDLDDSEEIFAPSLLAMNLKFDSAPPDDDASEEDNDKENVDPLLDRCEDDCSSPRGDPVKAFVDEEAQEEDDSDNDHLLFKDAEEDEDMEDSDELNDIIATEYEEKPIDDERRNELHQKWLEQQDAAGTDNLLQRLKVGSKLQETTPLVQEKDDYGDEEECNNSGEEDAELKHTTRINLKKAKQIISQMFLDKDDAFLSDEDEETEKRTVKNRLARHVTEEQTVSPVEDESSREVFGLIKKLNIAPESRKKPKGSSYFDSILKGGAGKSFSKSSFLGRSSSLPVPSFQRKGSTTVRSFIFGRDDSNSRSSVSTSDESTDTISGEKQMFRTVTAKFTSSQTKYSSSQSRKASAKTTSSSSLIEILKRSSEQSSVCNHHNDPVDLSHVMATFRIPKKQIKGVLG